MHGRSFVLKFAIMLHIVTPLFRYKNLPLIYSSIPKNDDITWHLAKTSRRPILNHDFIESDPRIKVYEIDCEDADLITKRNTIFSGIKDGHFHLLDDDTIFYQPMYDIYLKYKDFIGMVIGKQLSKNMNIRLAQNYPRLGAIDAGNVLCHSSILDRVKWEERKGLEKYRCRDFIFWDNCFSIFGNEKTILIPDAISIYNKLK